MELIPPILLAQLHSKQTHMKNAKSGNISDFLLHEYGARRGELSFLCLLLWLQ